MSLLFVDVHRPAEDENRVVAERVGRWLPMLSQSPLVELAAGLADCLGEDAGSGVVLVDEGEDPHPSSLSPWPKLTAATGS